MTGVSVRKFLVVLATLVAACSEATSVEGVNLVTEEELLLHVAEDTSRDVSLTLAGMMTDQPHNYTGSTGYAICDGDYSPDKEFSDSRTITRNVQIGAFGDNDCDPEDQGGRLVVHTTFGDSVYVNGTVSESNCHKLPSAGTVTTGEYRELTNDTSDPIQREITHSVEESKSVENSLSETIDLTNRTSVEAGAEFGGASAKATTEFESHLGIEHGTVESSSSTHSEEVKDTSTVEPNQIIGASFTLDDSAIDCDLNINSTVDYADLSVRVYRHDCGSRCESEGTDQLIHHGVISEHGHSVDFHFESVDDLVRLAKGTDPHCDGCVFEFEFGVPAQALDRLDEPQTHRAINLAGNRRYVSKDSASVVFRDITGLDSDCVHNTLSAKGTSVSDLDDQLGECR